MENMQHYFVNISAPNLVVICVDESKGEEKAGRIYHCYDSEPQNFSNVIELMRIMEELFDRIDYPQASTVTRYFPETKKDEHSWHSKVRPEKAAEQKEIIEYRGKEGTFITYVQYRQNSDWQGQVSCPEEQTVYRFDSTLEFLKVLSGYIIGKK